MGVEPSKGDPPKRKRRWFQFSLRTLLIFTLLCAIPCAWIAKRIEKKRIEREALAAIAKRGGTVVYDYQRAPDGSFAPDAEPPCPAWLRGLLGENYFSDVDTLFWDYVDCTDADMTTVCGFSGLKMLSLSHAQITDAGFAGIKRLRNLEYLALSETSITGAGLDGLRELSRLNSWIWAAPKSLIAGSKTCGN